MRTEAALCTDHKCRSVSGTTELLSVRRVLMSVKKKWHRHQTLSAFLKVHETNASALNKDLFISIGLKIPLFQNKIRCAYSFSFPACCTCYSALLGRFKEL